MHRRGEAQGRGAGERHMREVEVPGRGTSERGWGLVKGAEHQGRRREKEKGGN